MSMEVGFLIAVIAVAVRGLSADAAIASLISAFSGERLERYPHCHRDEITLGASLYEGGCPPVLDERLGNALLFDLHRHVQLHQN